MVRLCALGEAADSLHFDWWWRDIPLQICRLINQDSLYIYDSQKNKRSQNACTWCNIVNIQNLGLFIQN